MQKENILEGWVRRCSASGFTDAKLHLLLQRKAEGSPGSLLTPSPPTTGFSFVLQGVGEGREGADEMIFNRHTVTAPGPSLDQLERGTGTAADPNSNLGTLA